MLCGHPCDKLVRAYWTPLQPFCLSLLLPFLPHLLWAVVAVKLIAEATAKARAGILNLGQQAPPFFPSGQHYVQDKVFIGLDQAPEEFHLNEKLQGPGVGGVGVWQVGGGERG